MEIAFTPTQQRILAVLADGMPHHRTELDKCLCDDMAGDGTLAVHLTNLRKKLALRGETIVAIASGWGRRTKYQHVRSLNGVGNGKSPVDRGGGDAA